MERVKDWGTLVTVLLAIAAGIYQYARFEEKLENLGQDNKKIENRLNGFEDQSQTWISKNVQEYIGKDIIDAAKSNTDHIKKIRLSADKNLQIITENKEKFDKLISEIRIPSGAVLAFKRKSCPAGWKPITIVKGRVIVGAGKGNGMSERKFGDTGGEEKHCLTKNEMPSHNHYIRRFKGATNDCLAGSREDYGISTSYNKGTAVEKNVISVTGGNRPHENMPPFVVMLYCEKE